METTKTPKGTILPLINLKGKPYLQVAHRLVWFNESEPNFTFESEYLALTDEQTIVKTTIKIFDKDGKVVKSATGTKRETKKDFSDHTEKAETGAIGRALAMLGYGTQFCMADLDEGDRLADSPVIPAKKAEAVAPTSTPIPEEAKSAEAPKRNAFKKPDKPPVQSEDGF